MRLPPIHLMVRSLAVVFCILLTETGTASSQSLIDETLLADIEGGRWGVSVRKLDGAPVATVNAGQRFSPASTMKLVTTAAALHFLGDFSNGGWPRGTSVHLKQAIDAAYPTIILKGAGDATLSDDDTCQASCLRELALAVKAQGISQVQDIEVDDRLFERPHWPAGWAQEDLRFAFGTAVSALTVNDASALATIEPGPAIGSAPILSWKSVAAFSVNTSSAETTHYGFDLEFFKRPGSNWGEVSGTIGRNAGRVPLKFGLDDPSIYAGKLFRERLAETGITVHGRILRSDASPETATSGFQPQLIARQMPPPPRLTLEEILKESNNVHSEILLHHLSLTLGDRTTEAGRGLLAHLLVEAGAHEQDFNIEDGSGLSFYNRITPHAMTGLLSWASGQPWFDDWSGLFAMNGSNGTLEYRLSRGVPGGAVRAKSGTMFGADALAGYFRANSGREYAFAIFLNDSALSHAAARGRIDTLLRSMIETL